MQFPFNLTRRRFALRTLMFVVLLAAVYSILIKISFLFALFVAPLFIVPFYLTVRQRGLISIASRWLKPEPISLLAEDVSKQESVSKQLKFSRGYRRHFSNSMAVALTCFVTVLAGAITMVIYGGHFAAKYGRPILRYGFIALSALTIAIVHRMPAIKAYLCKVGPGGFVDDVQHDRQALRVKLPTLPSPKESS